MGQREAECAAARRCSTSGAKESGLGAPGFAKSRLVLPSLSSTTCHVMWRQSRWGWPEKHGTATQATVTPVTSVTNLTHKSNSST